MSQAPERRPTGNSNGENFEIMVIQHAQALRYPPTPDIADAVAQQLAGTRHDRRMLRLRARLAWLIALLVVMAGLLATPQVRAAVREFIQVGVVRIWLVESTPTATPATITPAPTVTPRTSLLPLKGETTLAEARQKAGFPIPLPTWPNDLGEPDAVFLQSLDGEAIVLVWMDKADRNRVRLSLHLLSSPALVWKKAMPSIVSETTVKDSPAYWTTGPYVVEVKGRGLDMARLIEGHVLIWEEKGITNRLETDLSLEEAVQVAESLQ